MNTLEKEGDAIQEHLEKFFSMIDRRVYMPFRYWRYFKLPADRALDKALLAIHGTITGFVARARALAQIPELADHRQTSWNDAQRARWRTRCVHGRRDFFDHDDAGESVRAFPPAPGDVKLEQMPKEAFKMAIVPGRLHHRGHRGHRVPRAKGFLAFWLGCGLDFASRQTAR